MRPRCDNIECKLKSVNECALCHKYLCVGHYVIAESNGKPIVCCHICHPITVERRKALIKELMHLRDTSMLPYCMYYDE